MEVDGARMQRAERAVLVGRAEQLAGVGEHDAVDVTGAGSHVDRAMRRLAPRVVEDVVRRAGGAAVGLEPHERGAGSRRRTATPRRASGCSRAAQRRCGPRT